MFSLQSFCKNMAQEDGVKYGVTYFTTKLESEGGRAEG